MPISVPLTDWNPQARAVVQELDGLFAGFSFGTYNGHDPSKARAFDAMVPGWDTPAGNAKGWVLARHIWEHRKRYNVWYVIFDGKIISQTRPEQGWQRYFAASDPSPSKSHRNHVHTSTYPALASDYRTVWLDRLLPGVTDSESARIVQGALKVPETGTWDAVSTAAAKTFQLAVGDDPKYCDGNLGRWQTAELLSSRSVWATVRTDPSGEPLPVDPPVQEPNHKPEPEPEKYPIPTSRDVWLDRLKPGVRESDSVWRAQDALQKKGFPVRRTGDYDEQTIAAVKAWQVSLGDDPKYCDGILGPSQTELLFADYTVQIDLHADPSGVTRPKVR